MKKATKRIIAMLLMAVLAVTCVGCGGNVDEVVVNEGTGEMPETLTIYAAMASAMRAAGMKSFNDALFFQEMEKLTGCHVDWIHPPSGGESEKFNLMIASGNLPDGIITGWGQIGGGVKSYADDGIVIPITNLVEKYMPNLTAFNKERPEVAKQFTLDDGSMYYVPFIRENPKMKVFTGTDIREDWLDKLGLEIPTNPEELKEVLVAFKTKDPNGNGIADEIPMTGVKFESGDYAIGNLLWMFGTKQDFYQIDGKVKYGIMEDEFEEGLAYVADLFKEGLIDQDYIINDKTKMDGKIYNDRVGFFFGFQPTRYQTEMDDGVKKVTGIPYLRKEGVKYNVFNVNYIRDVTNVSLALTTQNQNAGGTLKWLDAFFSEEGTEIMNYGVEGLTFNYEEDGYPRLTDYVFTDKNGNKGAARSAEFLGGSQSCFPMLQQWEYYEQMITPWAIDAIETWSATSDDNGALPYLVFTAEESEMIQDTMADATTYVTEWANKVVLGNAKIDELPKVRAELEKMGIKQVIECYQAALDRYNKR